MKTKIALAVENNDETYDIEEEEVEEEEENDDNRLVEKESHQYEQL